MTRNILSLTIIGMMLIAATAAADLARELGRRSGLVHVACPARPGIQDHGRSVHIDAHGISVGTENDGLVHLLLDLDDGEVVTLDVRSGHRPSRREQRAADLGEYAAVEVARFCRELIDRHEDLEVAEAAMVAYAIVDAETVRPMLAIARDRDRHRDIRASAVFWLGVMAGERVAPELTELVLDDREDIDLREHAVFALHQALADRPDHAVVTLGGIATGDGHPDVRRSALFWLSQIDDERVVDLFAAILLD